MNVSNRNRLDYQQAKARGYVNQQPSPTSMLQEFDKVSGGTGVGVTEAPDGVSDPVYHAVRFLQLAKNSSREVRNQVAVHRNAQNKTSRNKHGTKVVIGPMLNVIPDRIRTTLKFVLTTARASAAGPVYYQLTPSDCFDPAAAFGAGQPLGFDQWSAFYERFLVLRSRNTVHQNSTNALMCAMCIGNDPALSTGGFDRVAAQPRSWPIMYEPNATIPHMGGTWVSHAEVYGLSEEEFRANEDFYGTGTSSPANNIHATVY